MSSIIAINPNIGFDFDSNAILIPAKQMNALVPVNYEDCFEWYQRLFGVFGYMRLTKNHTYRVHKFSSNPMVWQPLKSSCKHEPLGRVTADSAEVPVCKMKAFMEQCADEFYDSCFDIVMNYANGNEELDANGQAIMNRLFEEWQRMLTEGARLQALLGGFYDYDQLLADGVVADGVDKYLHKAMAKTMGTCTGILQRIKLMAQEAGNGHLNVDCLTDDDFSDDGKDYVGEWEVLADCLRENQKRQLKVQTNRGKTGMGATSGTPVWLVSNSIHCKIMEDYRTMCDDITCVQKRLERRTVTIPGGGTMYVIYFDGIPVVPLDDLDCYSEYLKGGLHFAALTLTGNLQIGNSFGAIPSMSNNIGVRIQRSDRNEDYGMYTALSKGLMASAIANPDMYVGTCIFVKDKSLA